MLFSFLLLLSNISLANPDINIESYEKFGTFRGTPIVLVCDDVPVSMSYIEKAFKVWKGKGESYTKIVRESENFICSQENNQQYRNVIQVTGYRGNFDTVQYGGYTFWSRYKSNKELIGTKIELHPNLNTTTQDSFFNIVLHEIGHAYGYEHSDIVNDIMNIH